MYAPGPPLGTYRLRVPASRVGYVPDAQGGLPPGPHVHVLTGYAYQPWALGTYSVLWQPRSRPPRWGAPSSSLCRARWPRASRPCSQSSRRCRTPSACWRCAAGAPPTGETAASELYPTYRKVPRRVRSGKAAGCVHTSYRIELSLRGRDGTRALPPAQHSAQRAGRAAPARPVC